RQASPSPPPRRAARRPLEADPGAPRRPRRGAPGTLAGVSGPLEGVRVLDLSRLLPGAYATGLLGDLGAEVVKVEQPGGDPMRHFAPRLHGTSAFSWVTDRNKRSVVLNLRDPRGADAFLALARRADVVLESF